MLAFMHKFEEGFQEEAADLLPYPGWMRLLIWLGVMAFGAWFWREVYCLVAS